MRTWLLPPAAALMLLVPFGASTAPRIEKLGPSLFAYISDNINSSNSTFFIGERGILVVDTGLNRWEGQKLLREIRLISSLPVQFIVNTHYHPDHEGGNGVVGPDAVVISSSFTRERTLSLVRQMQRQDANAGEGASKQPAFRAATETFEKKLTIYLGDVPVEVTSAGPAHTMGDVYVYFPMQRTIATGDLYLTNSSPAMDQGSASNWIRDLDAMLALPADHFVPGHFEVGNRATATRFRDYLADLYMQVNKLQASGASAATTRDRINMTKFSDFRQYPQFQATFADNAEAIYKQLQNPAKPAKP